MPRTTQISTLLLRLLLLLLQLLLLHSPITWRRRTCVLNQVHAAPMVLLLLLLLLLLPLITILPSTSFSFSSHATHPRCINGTIAANPAPKKGTPFE